MTKLINNSPGCGLCRIYSRWNILKCLKSSSDVMLVTAKVEVSYLSRRGVKTAGNLILDQISDQTGFCTHPSILIGQHNSLHSTLHLHTSPIPYMNRNWPFYALYLHWGIELLICKQILRNVLRNTYSVGYRQ